MTSLWLDRTHAFRSDQFHPHSTFDTVVAGAGLTGLVTALLLARSGKKVLVVEARSPGAVTTGNTTAKVSLLQGTVLSALRKQYSQKVVDAYVEMNREGQAWLLRYLEDRGVAFQRRDAYTYATSEDGAEMLRRKWRRPGPPDLLGVCPRTRAPFPSKARSAWAGRPRSTPWKSSMPWWMTSARTAVDRFRRAAERVPGTGALRGAELEVQTDHGPVRARDVVLATGTPVLDRGLYFAKLKPLRSYAAALELPGTTALPDGMFMSVEQPTRSLRDYPADGRRLLLVGGNGHPVGRARSTTGLPRHAGGLDNGQFPGASLTHSWSAQDYQATNLMPFFGKLPRGQGRVYFATGYNKWGMTNAVAAALDITADILGSRLPWADTIHHRVTSPAGAASAASLNAGGCRHRWPGTGAGGTASAWTSQRDQPQEGAGWSPAAAGSPWRVHRRRHPLQAVRRLHPPGRNRALERQRKILGLPAPRLPLQQRRDGAGRTGHPRSAAD